MSTTPPRNIVLESQYKKDFKKVRKQGKDLDKLTAIVVALVNREALPPERRDHALAGNWARYRECHIEGDCS